MHKFSGKNNHLNEWLFFSSNFFDDLPIIGLDNMIEEMQLKRREQMDAGKAKMVKVNVDKYLDTLDRAGFGKDVQKLKKRFNEYGIKGETTFYQGPKVGDGEILFASKINGLMRFTDDGGLHYGVLGKKVASFSERASQVFIAGLFGEKELSTSLSKCDKLLLGGLLAARGCYDTNDKLACSYKGLKKAILEQDKAFSRETDRMWSLIEDMTEWAKEETCFLFCRVDPKDITEKMDGYKSILRYIDSKKMKYDSLRETLIKILTTYTGRKYAEKKGDVTCELKSTKEDGACTTNYYGCDYKFPGIASFNILETTDRCVLVTEPRDGP